MEKKEQSININEPPKLHELEVSICPVCHKGEGLISKAIKDEQALNHVSQKVVGQLQISVVHVMDPARAVIAFPVAIVFTDTCNLCGAVFATHQLVYKMTINQFQDMIGVMQPPTMQQGKQRKSGLVRP